MSVFCSVLTGWSPVYGCSITGRIPVYCCSVLTGMRPVYVCRVLTRWRPVAVYGPCGGRTRVVARRTGVVRAGVHRVVVHVCGRRQGSVVGRQHASRPAGHAARRRVRPANPVRRQHGAGGGGPVHLVVVLVDGHVHRGGAVSASSDDVL